MTPGATAIFQSLRSASWTPSMCSAITIHMGVQCSQRITTHQPERQTASSPQTVPPLFNRYNRLCCLTTYGPWPTATRTFGFPPISSEIQYNIRHAPHGAISDFGSPSAGRPKMTSVRPSPRALTKLQNLAAAPSSALSRSTPMGRTQAIARHGRPISSSASTISDAFRHGRTRTSWAAGRVLTSADCARRAKWACTVVPLLLRSTRAHDDRPRTSFGRIGRGRIRSSTAHPLPIQRTWESAGPPFVHNFKAHSAVESNRSAVTTVVPDDRVTQSTKLTHKHRTDAE
ncbi:hypothetical protein LXA43DRAFT_360101 [Ganoderma leucocontextum]|nr:hypothetical protein LXA43DRAFT_360101 [Ganoderma leucocontextum]